MSSAGLPGRSGVGARRWTERVGAPFPNQSGDARPGNRRARAFPSILHVLRRVGATARSARNPRSMPARGMPKLSARARGRPSQAKRTRKLVETRTNPSRTVMRTNPAATEPERTQAARRRPNSQSLAAERTRADPEFDRTRAVSEPERTQAGRKSSKSGRPRDRTNPSGRWLLGPGCAGIRTNPRPLEPS